MRTLLLYVSVTGQTHAFAQRIAASLGNVDLVRIKIKTQIPTNEFWKIVKIGFLVWWGGGMKYEVQSIDFDKYDTIILGSPVWMGRGAPPIISMTKKYNLKEKIKGLFVTCGYDPGIVFSDVKKKCKINDVKQEIYFISLDSFEDKEVQKRIDEFVSPFKSDTLTSKESLLHEK
ncbi:MAG: hypothetical protein P1U56_21395 [Saprospiraceae bacterium]|nr:hypothetical protein [Saprospiraceae bacterium]